MSSKTQFLVSMKFVGDAAGLTPEIRRIIDEVKQIDKQAKVTQQSLNNLGKGPSGKFGWVDTLSTKLGDASKKIDEINKKFNDMKMSGLGDMATGTGLIAPALNAVKQAGDVQMMNIELGSVYGLDVNSDALKGMNKQAKELSNLTLFGQKDLLGIDVELAHAQISKEAMQKVMPEATYLSEIEVGMGKSSDPRRSAYNFARMAEDARITNDEGKMSKFADDMYRTINVTHASTESLGETFKYGMPVTKNLGWNENDMLLASGMAAVNGMEGSMAGTHIKDFAERINPYKYIGTAGGQKQLGAMNEAGLLEGVQISKSKSGKETIVGYQSADLLKDKDHIKSYTEMVDVLTEKYHKFIETGKGGDLEWAALMNHIFGEQGQDFAIISSHKQARDKLQTSEEAQKGLHEQITAIRDSFKGQSHILHSNLENLSIEVGQVLLPLATDAVKAMQPWVSGATEWVKTHQDEVRTIGKVTAEVGAFMIAVGAAKLAIGAFGSFITPITKLGVDLGKIIWDNTVVPLKKSLIKSKAEEQVKDLAPQTIRANIVNLYGSEILGGGGVPGGNGKGGGTDVITGGGGSPTDGKGGTKGKGSKFGAVVTAAGASVKRIGQNVKAAVPVALAFGAYDIMTAPEGKKLETSVKTAGNIAGGWAGAAAGAEMGATIGTFITPGLGTVVGGGLGAVIGGFAGSVLTEKLTDSLFGWEHNVVPGALGRVASSAQLALEQAAGNAQLYQKARDQMNFQESIRQGAYTGNYGSGKESVIYHDNSNHTYQMQSNDPKSMMDSIYSRNSGNMSRRSSLLGP